MVPADSRRDLSDHGRVNHVRVLAIFAAILLLAACGPTANNVVTPNPASSRPSSAPTQPNTNPATPAASVSLDPGVVFQPLTDFQASDAYAVTGVTTTSNGLVAVGFTGYAGDDFYGRRQGLSWRSPDGLSWQQDAVDAALEFVEPQAVAALGADAYLLGYLSTCAETTGGDCTDSPDTGNVVLRSTGGGPWQRMPVSDELKFALIDGMVGLDDSVAMFGTRDDQDETPTVWQSTDGSNWSALTDLGGIDLIDSVVQRSGELIAFGTVFDEQLGDVRLAAGISSGGSFTRLDVPDAPGGVITDAVVAGDQVVGVGYIAHDIATASGVILASNDGRTWSQGSALDGTFDGGFPSDVFVVPSGYATLGYVTAGEDDSLQTARLWLSSDGLEWHLAGQLESAYTQFGGAAMGSAGLVVIVAHDDIYSYYGYGTPGGAIEAWLVPAAAFGE